MNTPNSWTRHAVVDHSVTVAGLALDLYPPPRGATWWASADPVFAAAGIEDTTEFRRQHAMTDSLGGFEIIWDGMRPEHSRSVALLSPSAVACVLSNATTPVDPTTLAAIGAAMAPK